MRQQDPNFIFHRLASLATGRQKNSNSFLGSCGRTNIKEVKGQALCQSDAFAYAQHKSGTLTHNKNVRQHDPILFLDDWLKGLIYNWLQVKTKWDHVGALIQ